MKFYKLVRPQGPLPTVVTLHKVSGSVDVEPYISYLDHYRVVIGIDIDSSVTSFTFGSVTHQVQHNTQFDEAVPTNEFKEAPSVL